MTDRQPEARMPWLTVADGLVIVAAIGVIAFLYATLWSTTVVGEQVEIRRGRDIVQQVSLTDDRLLDIDGSLGVSQIEIRGGQVRFVASPCHNKVCILSGWQQLPGEMAACLPNRVSLRILGQNPNYDAVNF